jgi:hypothetical protein
LLRRFATRNDGIVRTTANILTALGLAALVGGMLFFGLVVAPLVFIKLPPPVAGPFIRTVFPFYYAFIVISATLAACGFLLRAEKIAATALFVIVAVTYWLWFWLIPHLEIFRLAGDMTDFNRGHTLSVWINGAELIAGLWLLIRFAIRA